jgi:hypothetical protein
VLVRNYYTDFRVLRWKCTNLLGAFQDFILTSLDSDPHCGGVSCPPEPPLSPPSGSDKTPIISPKLLLKGSVIYEMTQWGIMAFTMIEFVIRMVGRHFENHRGWSVGVFAKHKLESRLCMQMYKENLSTHHQYIKSSFKLIWFLDNIVTELIVIQQHDTTTTLNEKLPLKTSAAREKKRISPYCWLFMVVYIRKLI